MTANFQSNPEREFQALLELQPNQPVMAMEFWAGWFDHWFEQHHVLDTNGKIHINLLCKLFYSIAFIAFE